jgi:hypothetical protein
MVERTHNISYYHDYWLQVISNEKYCKTFGTPYVD